MYAKAATESGVESSSNLLKKYYIWFSFTDCTHILAKKRAPSFKKCVVIILIYQDPKPFESLDVRNSCVHACSVLKCV